MLLRPYQSTALESIRSAYRAGYRAPLYQLATGGGKTVVFAAITKAAAQRGSRVWIVVHRRELLMQASRKLTENGVPHGLVKAGMTPDPTQAVQVVAVQSALKRLDRMGAVDLLVLDEAHHATSKSWRTLIAARPTAKVLGVTATPARTDGSGLGAVFDQLILGPSIADLTRGGFLAPCTIYVPPQVVSTAGLSVRAGDYAADELAERMDSAVITGDAIAHYQRYAAGVPAIAFCASVEHAEHVAASFRDAGLRSESVDGKMDVATRVSRLSALGSGGLDVLTSCDLISEGVDVPVVGAAILLRPTKSLIVFLQQIGRVLRPAPGKAAAIVLDHVGNVKEHGFPDDTRDWSLDGKRKKTKAVTGREPMRTCEFCFRCFRPAPVCPECGRAVVVVGRVPDQVSGELQVLTDADRELIRQQQRAELGRARTREQLQVIAKQRGYKPGWVDYIMHARAHSKTRRPIDPSASIPYWKGDRL